MALHYNIPETARGGDRPWSETVQDASGAPISGVICRVDGRYENTSGEDGKVRFMLAPGAHVATFRHPAYRFTNPVKFEVV